MHATTNGQGSREGEVCPHMILHAVVVKNLASPSYEAGTEHDGFSSDQAHIHQVRSSSICSANFIEGRLHPSIIVGPETRTTYLAYG